MPVESLPPRAHLRVEAAAKAIRQRMSGCRLVLAQVDEDADVPFSDYGPVAKVDVELLAEIALAAADAVLTPPALEKIGEDWRCDEDCDGFTHSEGCRPFAIYRETGAAVLTPPAEYEQIGWRNTVGSYVPGWRNERDDDYRDSSDWEPVYRRVER